MRPILRANPGSSVLTRPDSLYKMMFYTSFWWYIYILKKSLKLSLESLCGICTCQRCCFKSLSFSFSWILNPCPHFFSTGSLCARFLLYPSCAMKNEQHKRWDGTTMATESCYCLVMKLKKQQAVAHGLGQAGKHLIGPLCDKKRFVQSAPKPSVLNRPRLSKRFLRVFPWQIQE